MISFVIPCYQSEKTIESVVTEIQHRMVSREFEIVLVNDRSPDNVISVIEKLCKENKNITGIELARNFGQHAALMAGFSCSKGDIVFSLDDDGQTPVEAIPLFLDKLQGGYDVVIGSYRQKKNHSFNRNLGHVLNDKMACVLLNKPKQLFPSSFFAAKRFIVDELLTYNGAYPYILGLLLRATDRIVNVEVPHRERKIGKSGYSFRKLLSLWINGFTSFSVKPLRVSTWIGIVTAFMGFFYGLYVILIRLFVGKAPAGYSSLMAVILFIGGLIMIMLGLIGEYVGRMYININHSPQYVIRRVILKNKQEITE